MTTNQNAEPQETTTATKRVFLRASLNDPIEVVKIHENITDSAVPDCFEVVQRQLTYFGPKLWVETPDGEQYHLTAPGPNSEALLWERDGMERVQAAELTVEFGDDLPDAKICLQCNEEIRTSQHRTESFLGTCDR